MCRLWLVLFMRLKPQMNPCWCSVGGAMSLWRTPGSPGRSSMSPLEASASSPRGPASSPGSVRVRTGAGSLPIAWPKAWPAWSA